MKKSAQYTVQGIIDTIVAELDRISPENFSDSVKVIKFLFSELKSVIQSADKENRQKITSLANKLQQSLQERKELLDSLRELRTMYAMTQTIRTAKTPAEILSALNVLAEKILPITGSDIFVIEPKSGALVSLKKESDIQFFNKIQEYLEEGIIDWIIDEKHPVIIEDLKSSGESPEVNEGNFVFVPFVLEGEVNGIYVVYTSKPKHSFTQNDIELLSILGEQAVVALERIMPVSKKGIIK